MSRKLFVSIDEYWKIPARRRPRTYEGMMKRVKNPGGYWCLKQINALTGEVEVENWAENSITDNGIIAAFKGIAGAVITTVTPANIIALDQSLGYTTLTTAIVAATALTSITVGTLTGPTIPSGTSLLIGAGTGTTLLVSMTQAITGAGTYTCTTPVATANIPAIAAGANIRYANTKDVSGTTLSSISTADVTALSAPVSYTSALPAGQFTITPASSNGTNTGSGNRSLAVATGATYQFSTAGSPAATAANYTAGWLVNANPVAAYTNTFVHIAFDAPIAVAGTGSVATSIGQCTITEKL